MAYPPSVFKTFISGEILTASDLNASFAVIPSTNIPEDIDDYSANITEMRETADPFPSESPSLATDLAGEVIRLRYQVTQILKAIKGSSVDHWYKDAPTADVFQIGTAGVDIVGDVDVTGDLDVSGTFSPSGLTLAADVAAAGFKLTGMGAGSAAGHSVRFEQLKILQVVMGTSTTRKTTTSESFVNTNLSASITPSSTSSKVLVLAFGGISGSDGGALAMNTIARGGTNLGSTHGIGSVVTGNQGLLPSSMGYLDSPSTTSATTYSVQIRTEVSAASATWGGFGLSADATQVILLLEVNGI